MKMTVKYVRGGKVVSMDKRYADILVKAKRVTVVPEEEAPAFSKRTFKSSIVTKPVLAKETVTKFKPSKKAAAQTETEVEAEVKAEVKAEVEEPAAPVKVVMPVKENETISGND